MAWYNLFLKGPKTPTSSGCRRWEVCGGRTKRITPASLAFSMTEAVICVAYRHTSGEHAGGVTCSKK